MCRIDGPGITAKVLENHFNDCRRLDAGDDTQTATALAAGFDVDGEHALEALCLSLIARCRMDWSSLGDAVPADFRITISFGVAAVGLDARRATVLSVADTHLYRAKSDGRNRVVA